MEAETHQPPLPPIDEVILEAGRDFSTERRWELLGDEQAPLVRRALELAEEARQSGLDPGDAMLRGVDWAYTMLTEPQRREAFAHEMQQTLEDNQPVALTSQEQTVGKRPRLGRLVGALTYFAFRKV